MEDTLKESPGNLVGNQGYRRFLKVSKGAVAIDPKKRRLKERGWELEWNDIRRDLESLAEVEVMQGTQTYRLRTPVQGIAGKVLQAAGAAIPPSVKLTA